MRLSRLTSFSVMIGALQQCDTRELVEDTFNRFNLSDSAQKTDHLIEAMGKPQIFFSGGERDKEPQSCFLLFLEYSLSQIKMIFMPTSVNPAGIMKTGRLFLKTSLTFQSDRPDERMRWGTFHVPCPVVSEISS
jgi:hypothetical protein